MEGLQAPHPPGGLAYYRGVEGGKLQRYVYLGGNAGAGAVREEGYYRILDHDRLELAQAIQVP